MWICHGQTFTVQKHICHNQLFMCQSLCFFFLVTDFMNSSTIFLDLDTSLIQTDGSEKAWLKS